MKEQKLSTDILTSVISVILSTVLIVAIVIFGLFSSVKSLFSPKCCADIAGLADLSELFEDNPTLQKTLEKYGLDYSNMSKFLGSKATEGVFALYLEDVTANLKGDKSHKARFTAENVGGAMICHLDEMVEIAVGKSPTAEESSKAEKQIVAALRNDCEELVNSFPTPKAFANKLMSAGVGDLLLITNNDLVERALRTVIIVLSLGIFVLRYYKLRGFLWLGVDYIISGGILLILTILPLVGLVGMLISGVFATGTVLKSSELIFSLRILLNALMYMGISVVGFFCYSKGKKLWERLNVR